MVDDRVENGLRMRVGTVLVVGGGAESSMPSPDSIGPADLVVAADSGLDLARQAGLKVDIAIGDFDSVSESELKLATAHDVEVIRHPVAKDQTDLELALELAAKRSAGKIIVIGVGGGRIDHLLANFMLIADRRYKSHLVEAWDGVAKITVNHGLGTIQGDKGELVSLLPIGGDTLGVTTRGLAYPLSNSMLNSSSPIGISNTMTANEATVSIGSGTLLMIQPERAL